MSRNWAVTNRAYSRNATAVVFALALLLSTPALAEHRNVELESLRITIDSDWAQQGASGYLPVRFDITNLGEAREIVLSASQQHWFRPSPRTRSVFGGLDNGRIDIRQTVRLKRGDHVKLTMALPVFAEESFQFRLLENGRQIEGFSSFVSFQSGRLPEESPVLLATTPSTPLGAIVTPRSVKYGGAHSYPPVRMPPPSGRGSITFSATGSSTGLPPLDFYLDPERLPTNWIGFTSLRAVLIGPSEWKQLNPSQQDALRTWTAAGGDLLLVDGSPDIVFPPGQRPIGFGHYSTVLPYFLGHLHLLKSEDIRANGLEKTMDAINAAVPISEMALPAVRSSDWSWSGERGFRLAIAGVGEIPTRAYLLILCLFVVLIGPINYVYLWRNRRQVLLVLTVPLFSVTFILLMSGYAFFLQGLDVRARAVTFTILDQGSKRAATRSIVSLYPGGFMPGGGVRFASDLAVYPLGLDGAGARGRMALDLTEEQRFQSGFLRSRTPSNFAQIRVQPARERLSFERDGNRLQVVNGLGSAVHQVFYRDGAQIWSLEKAVPAGEKAQLRIDSGERANLVRDYLKDAAVAPKKFQQIVDNQPDQSYLAILERSPFWDPGVVDPQESQSFHLVLGYQDAQP